MEKVSLNLAVDSIAVYGDNKIPMVGTPAGWPENRYFDKSFSIFHFTPEEIKEKFNVEFPIHWPEVSEEIKESVGYRIFPHASATHFPKEYLDLNYNTVDYYIENKQEFVYLIHVLDDTLFKQPVFKLNPKVVEQVVNKKAKVLIFFPAEGYINHIPPLLWLNEFSDLNNLNRKTLIFTHANLTLDKAIAEAVNQNIPIKFKNLPVNYFEYNPWFIMSPHHASNRQALLPFLDEYIQENRKKKFRKHFNVLNRRPHLHRIYTYSEIKSVPILDKNCEISLGTEKIFDREPVVEHFKTTATKYKEYEGNYQYIKRHNFDLPVELDTNLLENRAGEFNRDFYKNTFCSLTVETAVNINQLFLSEKTFKPIFNLQPFLLYGNQYSLHHLQELGYKTFSDYWDESYDHIGDYHVRLKKISSIMQDICTWSDDKLYKITQELEPILIHNFNNFMYNTRFYEYTKQIGKVKKPKVKVNLI
jgi:hypothetical protein|tara:strand:+ start:1953 stop:3374 length:1422 start_codon:yes stop_codon:yes gene_type:complete